MLQDGIGRYRYGLGQKFGVVAPFYAVQKASLEQTHLPLGSCGYPAAMRDLGDLDRREMGKWLNNRAENSHLPFRRRERAMLRFGRMKTLQKFASVHANIHNHFNLERHIVDRQTFKESRSAALANWRSLAG